MKKPYTRYGVWQKVVCTFLALCFLVGVTYVPVYADEDEVIDYGQTGDIIDGSVLTEDSEASAEEVFEYVIVSENEEIMPLGTYLAKGTALISNAGSGKVTLLGRTMAISTCDQVVVAIYLEKYKNGGWASYKHWSYSASNVSVLTKKLTVSVDKGYYYRIKGYHGITKGSTRESCQTLTDGIKIN